MFELNLVAVGCNNVIHIEQIYIGTIRFCKKCWVGQGEEKLTFSHSETLRFMIW